MVETMVLGLLITAAVSSTVALVFAVRAFNISADTYEIACLILDRTCGETPDSEGA